MATSVFYIENDSMAFWNLEQAITEAKKRTRKYLLWRINLEKDSPFCNKVNDRNIKDCIIKYQVTKNRNGSVKVKGMFSIPIDEEKYHRKNFMASKTLSIRSLTLKEREEGITYECPFKED